jgi:hypothetical protein
MMNKLIIISCLFLSGCATTPTIVKVPVTTRCSIPTLEPMPILPIKALTDVSTPPEVMKAYVASLRIVLDDDDYVRSIIKPLESK